MRRVPYIALLGIGVLTLALGWLLYSETMLHWVVARVSSTLPGELRITQLHGRLAGPIGFRSLHYVVGKQTLVIGEGEVDWLPLRLLAGELRLSRLRAAQVQYTPGRDAQTPVPAATPQDDDVPVLPLAIRLDELAIQALRIGSTGQATVIQRLRLQDVRLTGRELVIHKGEAALEPAWLRIAGTLQLAADWPLNFRLDWSAVLDDASKVNGTGRLSGSLARLQLEQTLSGTGLQGKLVGQLRDVRERLAWQGKLELARIEPSRLQAGLPVGVWGGTVQGQGSLEQAELALQLHQPEGQGRLQLEGQWDARQAARASPSAEVTAAPHFEIRGTWQRLSVRLPSMTPLHSREGKLHARGTRADYRFELAGQLSGESIPASTIALQGRGNRRQARLAQLHIATLGGHIRGDGELVWQPDWQGVAKTSLSLQLHDLNPARHWPRWPGRIDGRLALHSTGPELRIDIPVLSGALRGRRLTLAGHLQRTGHNWHVQLPDARLGTARVSLTGRVGVQSDLQWTVLIPDLAGVLPDGSGRFTSEGMLRGALASPSLQIQLQGEGLKYRQYALASLQGQASLDLAAPGRLLLSLDGRDLQLGARHWSSLRLRGSGNRAQHELQLQARGEGNERVVLELRGKFSEQGLWQASLVQAGVTIRPYGSWRLAAPQTIRLGPRQLVIEQGCWISSPERRLCLALHQQEADLSGELDLSRFPLAILQAVLPGDYVLHGDLDGSLRYRRQAGAGESGRITLRLQQGALTYVTDEGRHTVGLQTSQLDVELGGGELVTRLAVPLGEQQGIEARLRLSNWHSSRPLEAAQPLEGRVRLRLDSIHVLESLVPDLQNVSGKVNAEINLSGQLAQPRLQGEMRLVQAAARIPVLGIQLRQVEARLSSRDGERIEYHASLASAPGRLEIRGETRLDARQGWPTRLTIRGENFRVVHVEEAVVDVSPRLEVSSAARRIRLSGELKIPSARLRPARIPEAAVAVSRDVVIESAASRAAQAEPTGPWQVFSRIKLILGEDVKFEGFGLQGQLRGRLDLREEPDRPLTASGNLAIGNGTYQAYGQNLVIERGKLFYTDNSLDEPHVDVRAVRRIGDIVAGINISGTLKEPVVSLFSEPPMNESQILSYLVLGKPLHMATEADGLSLMSAATALGLAQGETLAKKIGLQLGFEEVSIESGNGANGTARQSLVLGKYLSPRLYLRYVTDLLEEGSVVQLQYRISRKLELRTESGSRSGVDLFYTFERN